MGWRKKQASDRAEELHHDHDEEHFVDQSDEDGEEGLAGGIDEKLQQVNRNGPGDEQEQEGDPAVGDDFAAVNQAKEALGDGGLGKRTRHVASVKEIGKVARRQFRKSGKEAVGVLTVLV